MGTHPIIASFKAQYRKRFIEHQINSLMSGMDMGIDVYEAVLMVKESWHLGVTFDTIKNYWKHIGILSTVTTSQNNSKFLWKHRGKKLKMSIIYCNS